MRSDTLQNFNKLQDVGNEPKVITNHTTTNKTKREKLWMRYRSLLIGTIISFIPIFAVPVSKLFDGKCDITYVFYLAFCSHEIIFVGIVLAIAALNDFLSQDSRESKGGWTWLNIILIIFGAMIYGLLAIKGAEEQNAAIDILFKFNLVYFGFIFILESAKYIVEFVELKEVS